MKLFLVRHGDAIDKAFNSGRPLSPKGVAEIQLLSKNLLEENLAPTKIYHSQILRAEQSASILASMLKCESQLFSHEKLNGKSEFIFWEKFISNIEMDLMLVGHNPFMQLFTEHLTSTIDFEFHTGSCICLEKTSPQQDKFVERWSYSKRST